MKMNIRERGRIRDVRNGIKKTKSKQNTLRKARIKQWETV